MVDQQNRLLNFKSTWWSWYITYNLHVTAASDTTVHILWVISPNTVIHYDKPISVKAINDKHHATTVFHGDELVTNGTFTSETTGWQGNDAASAISIVSNRLRVTNGDASAGGFSTTSGSPTFSTIAGRTYLISYDSLQGTSANPNTTLFLGTSFNGSEVHSSTTYTSDGTHTYTFTATASQDVYLLIKNVTTTNGQYMDYDNVSIKEVGVASGWTDADQQLDIAQPALQSYNELAWFPGEYIGTTYDVNCGTDTPIDDIFDGGGTISAWVFINSSGAGDHGRILDKNKWYFYVFSVSSGACKLKFFADTDGTNHTLVTDAFDVKLGQWNHVALTYDSSAPGTASKMYLNGVLLATTATGSGTNVSDAASNLRIGNNVSGERTFGGSITGVSLHSTAINASKVLEIYNEGKELDMTTFSGYSAVEGYWRDNGLSTWTDLSTNTNTGTVNNITETLLIPQGVDGSRDAQGFIMNRARNTSSLNLPEKSTVAGKVVTVPTELQGDDQLAFIGVGDGFSLSYWVKLDRVLDNTRYVINRNDATDGYRSGVDSGEKIFISIEENGNIKSATGDSAISVDTWYHVVGTFDGDPNNNGSGEIKLYINGDTGGSTTNNITDSNDMDASAQVPFSIGFGHNFYFPGEIDGLLIYDKVLNQTEVTRNYKATKGSHRN